MHEGRIRLVRLCSLHFFHGFIVLLSAFGGLVGLSGILLFVYRSATTGSCPFFCFDGKRFRLERSCSLPLPTSSRRWRGEAVESIRATVVTAGTRSSIDETRSFETDAY